MKKLGYTFIMAVIAYVLAQLYIISMDGHVNFFFFIGSLSVYLVYFFIGFPTLLITENKSSIGARCKQYFWATLIGTFLFILLYFRLSEHPGLFLKLILPNSFLVGGISGILFFIPIEMMRALKTKVDQGN